MRKLFLPLLMLLSFQLNATNYYFSATGNDLNTGTSSASPWLSFSNLQSVTINPGDSILLKSGDVFITSQNIKLWKWVAKGADAVYGTGDDVVYGNVPVSNASNRIVIGTYPIHGTAANIRLTKDTTAIEIYNVQGIGIMNLNITGMGIGAKPKYNVVSLYNEDSYGAPVADSMKNYFFYKVRAAGGKNGFSLGTWGGKKTSGIEMMQCDANDNFLGGIFTYAAATGDISNIKIQYCKAYGNAGDPDALKNTGSGIVIGDATNALVERCVAYNNGTQSTASEGPVGIWTYNSSWVTIQYCESYNNKTAGPADGGGFDLDGGCQNSTIQYCYSHNNDGAGYLLCQYTGARAYSNNIIRYNISENDGGKNGYGAFHFYSSGANGGITNTEIYNNTIFNTASSAVKFQNTTGISGVKIRNNIFVTGNNKALVIGNPSVSVAKFENNNYWPSGGTFAVAGYASLSSWQANTSQEKKGSVNTGYSFDPQLSNPGKNYIINNPDELDTLSAYKLKLTSPMINAGQNLTLASNGSVDVGTVDYFGGVLPYKSSYDIGANEYSDIWPSIVVSPKTIYIQGRKDSTATAMINSNVAYKLNITDSWLSGEPISATGNKSILFTALQDNVEGYERQAMVIITKNDQSIATPDTVYVIQKSAYSVIFNVTDVDKQPIKDAAVTINGITLNTDINGRVIFTLISGTYQYSIKRIGYEDITASGFIVSNANISFQIKMSTITYKVSFLVSDSTSIVGNAAVSVGGITNYTSGTGMATFILAYGDYFFNISKKGYYTIPNTNFSIHQDTTINVEILEIPETVYNITFKVYDDTLLLSDVEIKIDDVNISTGQNGEAVFNLENGNYEYSVSKKGYDSIPLTEIKVQNEDTIVVLHLKKTLYTVLFTVKENGIPVQGATIVSDTISAITDAEGKALIKLLSGKYAYTISKEGFVSVSDSITVADTLLNVNVSIAKYELEDRKASNISVYPNPSSDYFYLSGLSDESIISIYSISGNILIQKKSQGTEIFMIDLSAYPAGFYFVKIENNERIETHKLILE